MPERLQRDIGNAAEQKHGQAVGWRDEPDQQIEHGDDAEMHRVDAERMGVRLDRVHHPALGLLGGRPGGTAAVTVNGKPVHAKKTISPGATSMPLAAPAEPVMATRANARTRRFCATSGAAM